MLLLKKPYTQGDVVSLKIINGDELIARFESEDSTTVTVNRPLALTMGSQGLGMIPWMFLADEETMVIQKSHILVPVSPSKKDASDQYMQGTTGIALR